MNILNDTDNCDLDEFSKPVNKNRNDLQVQLALSLLLGISALVTFCVCIWTGSGASRSSIANQAVDITPKMAVLVLRPQAPARSSNGAPNPSKYLLWLDTETV